MLRAIGLPLRLPKLDQRLLFEIGLVWVGATVANILLYAFQIVVGRQLGPEEYSLFGALFGIVYLTSALANATSVSVATFVSRLRARRDEAGARALIGSGLGHAAYLGAVLLLVSGLASPWLASYLHSESLVPVLTTGIIISLYLLLAVAHGALQGTERFYSYTLNQVVHAVSRLGLGLVALVAKLGVTGVLAAMGVSCVLTAGVGFAAVRPSVKLPRRIAPTRATSAVFLATLLASLAISFPASFDVVIVRHFFPAVDAGLYGGAAILGRIVLFLPGAICIVLFPKFSSGWAQGRDGRGLLIKGLAMTVLMSGTVALCLVIAPRLVLSLALGGEYAGAEAIVPMYVAAMFFFSLAVVFMYYHLATHQMRYIYLLLLPHVILEVVLVYVFHSSLQQVILMLLGVHASLALTSAAFTALVPAPKPRRAQDAVDGPLATATPLSKEDNA